MASVVSVLKDLWAFRGLFVTVLVLLLTLPVIFKIPDTEMQESAKRCLYVLLVMALLWLTEAIPIPATSLLPLVLFPLTGVMSASETSASYITDTSMLFLGGLLVAVALEESNLHKRVAIMVIMMIGSDPKWVMAGLMIPTWFLSMWMSNTATASMMIPIAEAVLHQIKSVQDDSRGSCEGVLHLADYTEKTENGVANAVFVDDISSTNKNSMVEIESNLKSYSPSQATVDMNNAASKSETSSHVRLCKGLTLCIAYASNIGGIATLTGTTPNLVLKGIADQIYNDAQTKNGTETIGSPISFSNWMIFALPLSALTLILSWLLLVIFFISGRGCCKNKKEQSMAIKKVVRDEWKKLGKVTMAQIEVLILFVFLAILWISRDPKESPGWNVLFSKGYVSDSTSAMLVAVLLFILPAKIPNVFCFHKVERTTEPVWTPLLKWEQVHKKLPWGVIILLGGGFALAKGVQKSHLDAWLSTKLIGLGHLDPWVLNFVLCLIVAAATEVTSNTAMATLLMPILFNLAVSMDMSPLYLMVSAAIATSFAFMLPVATPPNAIIFAYGYIRVVDMAFVGFFMNIIAVAALTLAVNTWGKSVYQFDYLDQIFKKLPLI